MVWITRFSLIWWVLNLSGNQLRTKKWSSLLISCLEQLRHREDIVCCFKLLKWNKQLCRIIPLVRSLTSRSLFLCFPIDYKSWSKSVDCVNMYLLAWNNLSERNEVWFVVFCVSCCSWQAELLCINASSTTATEHRLMLVSFPCYMSSKWFFSRHSNIHIYWKYIMCIFTKYIKFAECWNM